MEKDDVKEDLGGILTTGRWPHQATVRSSLECCDRELRGLGGWWWWWAGALVDKELNCEINGRIPQVCRLVRPSNTIQLVAMAVFLAYDMAELAGDVKRLVRGQSWKLVSLEGSG